MAVFLPRWRIWKHGAGAETRGAYLARTLTGVSALELLEQAVALLRAAPASAWNSYVSGAAPFLVAIVYGVARASIHKIAAEEIGFDAAILTALFIWMSWQKTRFARGIYAQLAASREKPDRAGISSAAFLQGTKLIMVPLSLLAVFPFAWSMAFYGNATVLTKRESARMAGLWPRQNWSALGLVAVFALVVFLNVAILIGILPSLARMFSGYENEFTRDPAAMFNVTFAAAALGITWLLIDPLIQAMYVVRCFKGRSVGSGADLQAALRRLVIGLTLAFVGVAAVDARPVTPAELDAKIRHTLAAPEYSWQNPESAADDSPQWARKVIQVGQSIRDGLIVARGWVVAKLREWFRSQNDGVARGTETPKSTLRWAIYAALFLIALLVILILRQALAVRTARKPGMGVPVSAVDLTGDVIASELPEDEWLRLTREALERGDFRLALRAAYLANLAWLGSAGLVAISRFKSNRDYEREVRLRSRSDEIVSLLKKNREVFESAWYGDEDKARSDVDEMQGNLVRMRELAHA